MYYYNAVLVRVVDGDTIDAIIDLGFDVQVRKRIRLAGINAQESRTRILKNLNERVVLPEGKQKSYKVRPGQKYKTKINMISYPTLLHYVQTLSL